MDRQIVYPGSIPLDTDLLHIQRHVLQALGTLARCVLGAGPVADGLGCVPGAGLSVIIMPGSLTGVGAVDTVPFGSLPPDGTPLLRTGANTGATTLATPAPGGGLHVSHLVQARVIEADEAPIALPYWNAADPSVPWSGPGNSGLAQFTRRGERVQLALKPGTPAVPGLATPPAADAGWVGLHAVTVRGATITAADIRPLPGAPFLTYRLPQLTPGFSRTEAFDAPVAWVVPAGVRLVRVRLVGGGGGGGGGHQDATAGFGGGGGGAGGYAEMVMAVVPGAVLAVAIGNGGAGSGPGVTAESGGTTTFAGGIVAASGGSGGASDNPHYAGGSGGTGMAGTLVWRGGFGTDGAPVVDVPAGSGGASAWGGGGRGAYLGGAPSDGQSYGSGAGGAYGPNSTGGRGAGGLVVLEY